MRRALIYLEDQYLWSFHAARCITDALRREPDLRVVVVIPRYPDPDGVVAGGASRIGREHVLDALTAAGDGRVAVYDLENDEGTPIYVHSKVCVVDDLWMAVGSDNLNRRSWTHDSEVSCAVIDVAPTSRVRPSTPPVGASTPADWRATCGSRSRPSTSGVPGTTSTTSTTSSIPASWFDAMRDAAAALDAWHAGGRRGPRPPGHLRVHPVERVRGVRRVGHRIAHRLLLDPDGRPRDMRRADRL